jgi:hypothetical protein
MRSSAGANPAADGGTPRRSRTRSATPVGTAAKMPPVMLEARLPVGEA